MRVYLPGTTTLLHELIERGHLGPTPLTAFALTPALREWYVDDDVEELEYAASSEAARASLRLLDVDPVARRRRVVIAADVPDATVVVRDEIDRGVVQLGAPITLAQIASVHIDDADAEPAVAAAVRVVLEADLGDEVAQAAVDDAEGYELSWYASQEISAALELM